MVHKDIMAILPARAAMIVHNSLPYSPIDISNDWPDNMMESFAKIALRANNARPTASFLQAEARDSNCVTNDNRLSR